MTRSDLWLGWLLTYLAHSTVLIGAAWLLARFALRQPGTREVLWRTALLGGLFTATGQVEGWLPSASEFALGPVVTSASSAPVSGREPTVVAVPEAGPAAVVPVDPSPAGAGSSPALRSARSLSDWLVPAWALIAFGLVGIFAWRRMALARRLGPRRVLTDHPMAAELDDLVARAGVRRRIVLTVSDRLASPIAVGAGEICVPARSLEQLAIDERRSMLAHELAHLLRLDPAWLTVATLVERVFFFQPLNRMARRALQAEAELLCDEWAATHAGSGLDMARCLVKVAEWIDAAPRPVPVAGMAEERSHLMQRVERLLAEGPPPGRPRRLVMIGAVAALLTGAAAVAPSVSLRGQVRGPVDSQAEAAADAPGNTDGTFDAVPAQSRDTSTAVVSGLIEALRDGSPAVRRAAANSLGKLKARRGVSALAAASGDDNVEVRRAVVEALGEIGDRGAVRALEERTRDADAEVREAAIEALSEFGDDLDSRVVRGWLDDENASVRRRAVDLVGERKDRAALDRLIELTGDPSAEVRRGAIRALGEIRAPAGLPAVVAALSDSDPEIREAALSAIDDLDPPELPAAVLGLLADPADDVRHQAAHLAGEHRSAQAVPALRRLLTDPSSEVREAAVEALAEIRTQDAVDALVSALKSEDAAVRKAAAEALGERHE